MATYGSISKISNPSVTSTDLEIPRSLRSTGVY